MSQIKEINIKNRTYYLFNDTINIKKFYPNRINRKNIILYYIEYITIIKFSCTRVNSVNPLSY